MRIILNVFIFNIKAVLPIVQIQFLSSEAKGKLLPGDFLVGIDDEDITTWTVERGKIFFF